jgi:hypothetical protein
LGIVTACHIVNSSGSDALDQRACAVMMNRLRVQPSLDELGNIVPGTINGTVRWRLPAR